MSRRGEAAVARARALIGVRFVAQGRDAAHGLDCVGLVLAAHALSARGMRDDYRLAGDHRGAILAGALRDFRRVSRRRLRAGDVLLFRLAAQQWHLALWTGTSVIEADARRRAVSERPGLPAAPIAAAWRARVHKRKAG